jgi:hypothetical protein
MMTPAVMKGNSATEGSDADKRQESSRETQSSVAAHLSPIHGTAEVSTARFEQKRTGAEILRTID